MCRNRNSYNTWNRSETGQKAATGIDFFLRIFISLQRICQSLTTFRTLHFQRLVSQPCQIYFLRLLFMKINCSDSFFPTKFRPNTAGSTAHKRNQPSENYRSFKLVKKVPFSEIQPADSQNEYQSLNIFKNAYVSAAQFNFEKDRPIGGSDMFLKQHNKKTKTSSTRKMSYRNLSPENKKKTIIQEQKPSTFFQKNQDPSQLTKRVNKSEKQQIFKSHHSYQPPNNTKTATFQSEKKIVQQNPNIKRRALNQNNWVQKQTDSFQNKMSLLNEVYYKKPLVERYGERYFEFFLRNRHEQDFPPPVFIHQVKSDEQAKSSNNDRFISKVRKIYPNSRNFEKLVLRGKKFKNNQSLEQENFS